MDEARPEGRKQTETRLPGCAFVVPVYNHASTLADVLRKAGSLGAPVFVVDDGSTDGSGGVARSVPGVTVLTHETNRGKGAALRTGFEAAAKVAAWAISVDADGQHDPADALALVEGAGEGARPIVVGTRTDMNTEHVPWTSRFGRGFSNLWVRLAGGGRLQDSQSGFRLYPLPEVLGLRVKAKRFQYEVEVLAIAGWNRFPVREAPVKVCYQPKGERVSHFRPFVDFWRNAATFSRLIFKRIVLPRRVRMRRSMRPLPPGAGNRR